MGVDLAKLAKHMEEHNTGFTEAMCLGMMTAMVKCIKEMLLAGKNVKIDNLAIFSVGIRNKVGAKSEADFTAANNIAGVKLRARATGTLSNTNLNTSANVKKASVIGSASTSEGGNTPSGENTPSGGNSQTGGNTPSGGNSQTGGSSSDNGSSDNVSL